LIALAFFHLGHAGAVTEAVGVLLSRGQAAVEAIAALRRPIHACGDRLSPASTSLSSTSAAQVLSRRLLVCCRMCWFLLTRHVTYCLPCSCHAGAVTEAVGVLLSRGQAAVEAIAAAPDPTSRRDAEAFQQLQLIRQMVELAGQGQWDRVLQVRVVFNKQFAMF
jgi:hypothetical protein